MNSFGLVVPVKVYPSRGEPFVVLTREKIHVGTYYNAFTKSQLECLGVTWEEAKKKGWLTRLIGKKVSKAAYERYLKLRTKR